MQFHLLTIFPNILDSYIKESIIKRAQEVGAINIKTYNLRDWTTDKHHSVDDTPYGGGAGMLMKIEPLYRALQDIRKDLDPAKTRTILLSAQGRTWKQGIIKDYQAYEHIILICGRYEGVDARLLNYIDEEISIGDYVLTGGELAAMVIIDSLTRLLPGVLGNEESSVQESHSQTGLLEYPQYTRPEIFTDDEGATHQVPDVLLSGHHHAIESWRTEQRRQKSAD